MNDLQPGPARFDLDLDAWILSSYRDVADALRESALSITDAGLTSTGAHAAVREAGAEFAHSHLSEWQRLMEQSAARLTARLPTGQPVDLFRDFASPWALQVAALVTGVTIDEAESLSPIAHEVFIAAARATGPGFDTHALDSAMALAQRLPSTAMAVQGFVALCHTLPHFLAAGWDALLSDPDFTRQLRSDPPLIPQGIEELLRFAAPSRAVFRVALSPVNLGSTRIAKGDKAILLLSAANRDPGQFAEPNRLDLHRGATGHLAFGKGAHACAGAQLIRLAAVIATRALLSSTVTIDRSGPVEWLDGFAIRAPASLPVVLRSQPE